MLSYSTSWDEFSSIERFFTIILSVKVALNTLFSVCVAKSKMHVYYEYHSM